MRYSPTVSSDEQRAASDPVGALVAAAVRALRANARLTLAELAERTAEVGWPLSVASLLRLEQHKRRIEVGDLDALAKVFRIDPAQLLEGRVDVAVRPQTAHGSASAGDARVVTEHPFYVRDRVGRTPEEAHRIAVKLGLSQAHDELPDELRGRAAALAAVRFEDFLSPEEREAVLRGSAEVAAEAARRAYVATAAEMKAARAADDAALSEETAAVERHEEDR
jgi:transcriptional regulator with XRE-family HTH domain